MLDSLKFFLKKKILIHSSPVLLYHNVEKEEHITLFELDDLHNVSPAVFQKQIEFLQKNNRFVFVDELFQRLRENKSVRGLACLTFDDGYKSILCNSIPFLTKNGIPFTVFLNKEAVLGNLLWRDMVRIILKKNLETEFINFTGLGHKISVSDFYRDTKSQRINSYEITVALKKYFNEFNVEPNHELYLSVEEIQKILTLDECMIGNHTVNHFIMSDLNDSQLKKQITENHDFLTDNFHPEKLSDIFSIPFGGVEMYDDRLDRILRNQNYKGFLTTERDTFGKLLSLRKKTEFPSYGRYLPKNFRFEKQI